MKTILLTIITLTMSTGLFANNAFQKDERLCKVFQDKTVEYKKTMRNDDYAKATLKNYENKKKLFCSK